MIRPHIDTLGTLKQLFFIAIFAVFVSLYPVFLSRSFTDFVPPSLTGSLSPLQSSYYESDTCSSLALICMLHNYCLFRCVRFALRCVLSITVPDVLLTVMGEQVCELDDLQDAAMD